MISAILAILGFLLPLLEDYINETKEPPAYSTDKKRFDGLLNRRDNSGISAMFEQLRRPAGSGNPGRSGNKKIA